MKIKRITYSNFRNFKDKGSITFSTDGKVSIVYGKNGDGKTTLHQLFQWILYNEVHFNKTASDKMYNLEYESAVEYDKDFSVIGSIDFEHGGVDYTVRREYVYKKGLDSSTKIKEDFSLRKKNEDDDWGEKLPKPEEVINELLPKGLSEYFFFDGESMIADLSRKGADSADKLKKSLFTIFGLDVYANARDHIGSTDLKTTVLGKLYLELGSSASSSEVDVTKTNIENAQNKIAELEDTLKQAKDERKRILAFIQEVSEKIGSAKSQEEYERLRKEQKQLRDQYLEDIKDLQNEFGELAAETFPKLLIYKKMQDAKKHIKLKIDQEKLLPGVNRMLIDALCGEKDCICGRPIFQEQKDRLLAYYKLLPPDSYKGLYDNFTKMADLWGREYDREQIEKYIRTILEKREAAAKCDSEIQRITEAQKDGKELQALITDRSKAEDKVDLLNEKIKELEVQLNKYKMYLNKEMKKYDALVAAAGNVEAKYAQIDIMERVKEFFAETLTKKASEYSAKLCYEIQSLIKQMLTSERTVSVSPDFFVKVYDSFGDESKSEGQFAIVSFAYIGGILKMLSKEEALSNKEYPLVLDGPFSKLDADQRQNVIDTIPAYAPQVIIFSKDDLQPYFESSMIGHVYTIKSNAEKNVATIEEGFLWNE